MYLTIPVTCSDFRAHIFCTETTQELPNRHNEVVTPKQLSTDALSQIEDEHTRHCEMIACANEQRKEQLRLENLSRGMRMADWKMSPHPTFQNAPPPLAL